VRRKNIAGRLESVRRDAAYWRAFAENKREVEYWHTAFGDIIHMEIGAMLVGHIHNYRKRSFKKGDEKGYFSYGGSSIVEIVGKDIEIDGDILKNSERGFETKIKIGERIGYGSNKAT
jgi:phosphatidylserine decarboxylase